MEKNTNNILLKKQTYTGHLTEAQLLSSDINNKLYTIKNAEVKEITKELKIANDKMAHRVSRSPDFDNEILANNPQLRLRFREQDAQITEVHKVAKAHYKLLNTEFKNHPDKDCSSQLVDFMAINKLLLKKIDTLWDIFF